MSRKKPTYHFLKALLLIVGLLGLSLPGLAQQQALFTQFDYRPLWMNPAFSGSRNSLAIDLATRQQWIGVEGAPMTYYASAHLPINETMMSAGVSLQSDKAGPVMANEFSISYAYLLRINGNHLLSAGINAGVGNHWVGLNKLALNEANDPNFQANIENGFTPVFGAGLVLHSPWYHLGFSMPGILPARLDFEGENALQYQRNQVYYFTAGTDIGLAYDHNVSAALLARMEEGLENAIDFNLSYQYAGRFSLGGSWRMSQAFALIAGVQINENLRLTYSYDYPLGSQPLNLSSSQEITLSFDLYGPIIPNLDREFFTKRKSGDDGTTKSIRYF